MGFGFSTTAPTNARALLVRNRPDEKSNRLDCLVVESSTNRMPNKLKGKL